MDADLLHDEIRKELTKLPPPTKPAGSDGVASPGGYLITNERSPSLIGTQKWVTFSNLEINTAVVASAMGVWTQLAGSVKWTAKPNKRGGKDAQRGADLVTEGLLEAQMSKPWSSVVRKQVVKKFRGFAMHEALIRKRSDGKIGIGDLQHRPQWSVHRWIKQDEQTAWDSIEQRTRVGNVYKIPRERLLYSVEDTLTDSPDGVGLLRCLAEISRVRDLYFRFEGIGFQTGLNGMPIARVPLAALAAQAVVDGVPKDDAAGIAAYIATATKFMDDLISGHNKTADMGVKLDSSPYTTADAAKTPSTVLQWGFDVVRATVAGLPEVASALGRIDREMARLMLAEWLLLGAEGSGGAFSMHADKTAMFGLVCNASVGDVGADATRDVATRIVALNGLDPETCTPTLVPEPISKESIEVACKALLMLSQAGLHPDDEAPDIIRDRCDIPAAPKIPAQDWLLPRGATIAPPGTEDTGGPKPPVVGQPGPASTAGPKTPMPTGDAGAAGATNANTEANGGKKS